MADDNKKDFESYLSSEYKNIIEAHFRTMETISSFFRYYLLIMSASITLVVVFININSTTFLSIQMLHIRRSVFRQFIYFIIHARWILHSSYI